MSNDNRAASHQDPRRLSRGVAHNPAIPDPVLQGNAPLSSEDIDAQIRWFFDNALERKTPPHAGSSRRDP
jgi:hypothetical protein